MNNLKNKLLALDIVDDNDYLDKYCELILTNTATKKEKFKTQKHHIIPRAYFALNNIKLDNSLENIVNLYFKDHILAHYFLALCAKGEFKFKCYCAFCYLAYGKSYVQEKISLNIDFLDNLDYAQQIYSEYRKNLAE